MFAWEICMRYRICDSQGGRKLILGPKQIRKIIWPLALMIKDLDILCSSSINLFIKAKKKNLFFTNKPYLNIKIGIQIQTISMLNVKQNEI